MSAKTIVITGASDGVGAAAAEILSARGHQIVVVGRSPSKTEAVADRIGAPYLVADFADLSQVRALAQTLAADYPRIDVLANNAGGLLGARQVTVDGFEKTFQVNHLAGFLLTNLLMPNLAAGRATVIQTSSVAARIFSRFDIDDLNAESSYSAQAAYGNAKLDNILFTRELQRRYGAQISAVAFHPGVVGSNFGSEASLLVRLAYRTPVVKDIVTISPAKGADQLVWLAEAEPGVDFTPGEYYQKRKVARSAAAANNDEFARSLWEQSAAMVGL